MKIGIIGTGSIGSILARLWVKGGHEVILSSRHPEKLASLATSLGSMASVGTPEEAARLGEVILLSIPLIEVSKLSEEVKNALKGKIVMDTTNPFADRDGSVGRAVIESKLGSAVWTASQIPGARVVKAFNTVYFRTLDTGDHRKPELIGIPLASDDQEALKVVSELVFNAGFGPLIVGGLSRAKDFDPGTRPFSSGASVNELKRMLLD